MSKSTLTGARAYMDAARAILGRIADTQESAIDQAAEAIVRAIQSAGLVYLLGTGHSHELAEEGHSRAGGLAACVPILSSSLMLHEGAATSSRLERTLGIGPAVLARYNPTPNDVLIVFSNSGVNAVPVETAIAAKEMGLRVIAVVALEYAAQAPLSPIGKRLADVADIVIDNQLPPGDALVEVGDTGVRAAPGSTVAGAFILNAIVAEVACRLAADGPVPVYISSNMPGAAAHNDALEERYRSRNPHI